jgi:hypothetical protein
MYCEIRSALASRMLLEGAPCLMCCVPVQLHGDGPAATILQVSLATSCGCNVRSCRGTQGNYWWMQAALAGQSRIYKGPLPLSPEDVA